MNTEHTLSIVLADAAATTDGKKLAREVFGHHECSYWMSEAFPAFDNKAPNGSTPKSFKTWAQLEAAGVRVGNNPTEAGELMAEIVASL